MTTQTAKPRIILSAPQAQGKTRHAPHLVHLLGLDAFADYEEGQRTIEPGMLALTHETNPVYPQGTIFIRADDEAGIMALIEAIGGSVIPHATAKLQFLADNLNEGELYAGILLGEDEAPDHHLILLPGEADALNFAAAQDWAKKQGGDLPTRREQSLLFANLKTQFKRDWYWSGEQHAAFSGCAWCRYFGSGHQGGDGKSAELRARAVRRLVIQ